MIELLTNLNKWKVQSRERSYSLTSVPNQFTGMVKLELTEGFHSTSEAFAFTNLALNNYAFSLVKRLEKQLAGYVGLKEEVNKLEGRNA